MNIKIEKLPLMFHNFLIVGLHFNSLAIVLWITSLLVLFPALVIAGTFESVCAGDGPSPTALPWLGPAIDDGVDFLVGGSHTQIAVVAEVNPAWH